MSVGIPEANTLEAKAEYFAFVDYHYRFTTIHGPQKQDYFPEVRRVLDHTILGPFGHVDQAEKASRPYGLPLH